jgi:hypothetical protein
VVAKDAELVIQNRGPGREAQRRACRRVVQGGNGRMRKRGVCVCRCLGEGSGVAKRKRHPTKNERKTGAMKNGTSYEGGRAERGKRNGHTTSARSRLTWPARCKERNLERSKTGRVEDGGWNTSMKWRTERTKRREAEAVPIISVVKVRSGSLAAVEGLKAATPGLSATLCSLR